MIPLLLLFVVAIAMIQLAGRLPLLRSFRAVIRLAARARRVVGYGRGLERRKERMLQAISLTMLGYSLRCGALLALVVLPLDVLLFVDSVVRLGVRAALLDWQMRGALLVLMVSYALLRRFARHLQRG